MKKNTVSNLNFLDREAALYKNSRNQLETSAKNIQTTIESNTKQEMDAVNTAIKNLNEKVEQILKSEQIKAEQNKMLSYEQQMKSSIKIAGDTFFKVREVIRKKNITNEEKIRYEKELYSKIISKFLSQEEIEEFERMIKMGPMLIISNPLGPNGPIDSRMIGGPEQRRLRD